MSFGTRAQDGSNLAATQRAYSMDEIRQNAALKPDVQYYLASQVHPVVSRLCELLDGIDNVRIAQFLGNRRRRRRPHP